MIDECPDERLRLFVGHDRDLGPARVLQTGREKVDALPRPVEKAHVDLPEIVLREFAGKALEADERSDGLRPQGGNQLVQRRLPACVPFQLGPAQNFHGQQIRLARQDLGEDGSKGLRFGGSADGAAIAFRRCVDVSDRRFTLDASDASE